MVTCSSPVVDGGRWREGHAHADSELQSSATKPGTSPSEDSPPSSACRALVYDAETGSLRYSKPSGRAAGVKSSRLSPRLPRSPPTRFQFVLPESHEQHSGEGAADVVDVVESPRTPPSPYGKLQCGAFTESGETSPTCVIQNSAVRSNSSSPTGMSSAVSKASVVVPGREGLPFTAGTAKQGVAPMLSAPEVEAPEISSSSRSEPRSDPITVSKESNWSYPLVPRHEDFQAERKQNSAVHDLTKSDLPVESTAKAKKSNHGAGGTPGPPGRAPAGTGSHTASIVHCCEPPGGVFSFNATHMPLRAGHKDMIIDPELFSDSRGDTSPTIVHGIAPTNIKAAATHMQQQQQQQQLGLSRRTYSLAPLLMLKPTPSKWDDAEKWLPGSECQSAATRAKTSRSGPLLAQMVAAQAGMFIPWRGAINGVGSQVSERHVHDHHLSSAGRETGVAPEQRAEPAEVLDSGLEVVEEHVKAVQTPSPVISPRPPQGLADFAAADEKQRINSLLRGRHTVENTRDLGPSRSEGSTESVAASGDDDGDDDSASPSRLDGSFLKLGARMEKPQVVVAFSPSSEDYDSRATEPADLDIISKPSDVFARNPGVSETRDMGTAMTPVASVDPSRTSTPPRATTTTTATTQTESKISVQRSGDGGDHAEVKSALSPKALTMSEKAMQERKTRQEIVALGMQLGKASIAAAWAALEKEKSEESSEKERESCAVDVQSIDESNHFELDLANKSVRSQQDVFASRAEVWQEAEKAKYTIRFEQDQARIQAWEEHEKAKAEADMRKAEVKAERLKSQAHEKLAHRLATARRQAEELRLAAEARRADAAAKAARKAETLKANGKIPNFLFLSYFCA